MKARIRKTGEIVEVICYGGSPNRRSDALDYVNYIDSKGGEHTEPNHLNYYWDFEPIGTDTDEKYWQDVRERASIAALQGLISNRVYADYMARKSREDGFKFSDAVSEDAIEMADALVEQLKKGGMVC